MQFAYYTVFACVLLWAEFVVNWPLCSASREQDHSIQVDRVDVRWQQTQTLPWAHRHIHTHTSLSCSFSLSIPDSHSFSILAQSIRVTLIGENSIKTDHSFECESQWYIRCLHEKGSMFSPWNLRVYELSAGWIWRSWWRISEIGWMMGQEMGAKYNNVIFCWHLEQWWRHLVPCC